MPLLTAQEIKQLGDEDVISFHRRLPPFQAKRMDWRRYGVLAKRWCGPVPRLPNLPRPEAATWQRPQQALSPYFDPDMAL